MIFLQTISVGVKTKIMDTQKDDCGKSLRPVRNRRYTRRSFMTGQRPPKRLFTPEIKRYLKDWLVRRRDNPYPNREEKKHLAHETGLTYIQICNWFANWRRKLKNVNLERNESTWGHLIRTYNNSAQGNVEQFSLCSDDSIWSEPESSSPNYQYSDVTSPNQSPQPVSSSYESATMFTKDKIELINNNTDEINSNIELPQDESKELISSPMLLNKWIESAARFQPSENNYSWWADDRRRRIEPRMLRTTMTNITRHGRDEVEAAVALTALASAANRIIAPEQI